MSERSAAWPRAAVDRQLPLALSSVPGEEYGKVLGLGLFILQPATLTNSFIRSNFAACSRVSIRPAHAEADRTISAELQRRPLGEVAKADRQSHRNVLFVAPCLHVLFWWSLNAGAGIRC